MMHSRTRYTGVPLKDKTALWTAHMDTWAQPEWDTAKGRSVQASLVSGILVHAKNHKYWGQEQRWVDAFTRHADAVADEAGIARLNAEAAIASDAMHERFIAHLALSGRGRTVPRAARRHLSTKRRRSGLPSLNDNPMISMIVAGAERAQPSTPSQAADIPMATLAALSRAVVASHGWFKNMVATMALTGYLTLMRLVELRAIRKAGVVFVTREGERLSWTQAKRRRRSGIRGVLIHVAWRKSTQDTDCWIPMSCPMAIGRLMDHRDNLDRMGHVGPYLFPARTSSSPGARAHPENRTGSKSFVKALRKLFVEHKLLNEAQAKLVRGHSLRVGGSNNCRRQGISDGIHRLMGGWATLTSSSEYMALTAAEQFKITDKIKAPGRVDGPGRAQAHQALAQKLPRIAGGD